ncbi:unannotated protein [freshwater metagenome]|uniref:Unannotated protein n=1 Tax=freshwater metagenome TaxID=449393 RepID=A0A6J7CK98_9ZZZZ|nr:hypothetical protein [Actinomycetota bacterium]
MSLFRRSLPLVVLVVAALLAGCGDSAPSTSSGASSMSSEQTRSGGEIKLEATDVPATESMAVSTMAGRTTVSFHNDYPTPHGIRIESSSKEVVGAIEPFSGGSRKIDVELTPGTYRIWCVSEGVVPTVPHTVLTVE